MIVDFRKWFPGPQRFEHLIVKFFSELPAPNSRVED